LGGVYEFCILRDNTGINIEFSGEIINIVLPIILDDIFDGLNYLLLMEVIV
jgi:hypothetical protein